MGTKTLVLLLVKFNWRMWHPCFDDLESLLTCFILFFFYCFFFLIYFYLFLFMAVLSLRFCARAFSSCDKWGPLFIAVRGPLIIAASLTCFILNILTSVSRTRMLQSELSFSFFFFLC